VPYSGEKMTEVVKPAARQEGFELAADVDAKVRMAPAATPRDRAFGNGHTARSILEEDHQLPGRAPHRLGNG
jgi:hypothetical protein